VAVNTKTIKHDGQPDEVVTANLGVKVSTNAEGGLDVLFSPAVKSKLEELAKLVTPCPPAKKAKRHLRNKRQDATPPCGLADYLQRVKNDAVLLQAFSTPLAHQMFAEVDKGYTGNPADYPSFQGGGFTEPDPNRDSGYFTEDEGFFRGNNGDGTETGGGEPGGGPGGEPGGGGGETGGGVGEGIETAVIAATEEEAGALAAMELTANVGTGIAASLGVVGAGTVLGKMYSTIQEGGPIPFVVSIPKDNISKITRPKKGKGGGTSEGQQTTTSTSSGSCTAVSTGLPECEEDCKETSTVPDPKATNLVDWACSDGKNKGCPCNPQGKSSPTSATWPTS